MIGSRFILRCLSSDSAGVVIGLAFCATSWLVIAQTHSGSYGNIAAYALLMLSALLLIGGVTQSVKAARRKTSAPAPGQLVDIGGYRVHLLAEGNNEKNPTIVWLAGSHSGGYLMSHLHDVLKKQYRSILYDRPGSGWSDVGPFPRRTRVEAEELETALRLSGEKGPFVLIGHSYGGLLAANYARRYPTNISGVVLFDATPVDYLSFNPMANMMAKTLIWSGLIPGLLNTFGISFDFFKWSAKKNPQIKNMLDCIGDALEPALTAEARPGVGFSAASLFRENATSNLHKETFERIIYDGELQDIPLYIVIPPTVESMMPDDASPSAKRMFKMLGITPEIASRADGLFSAARKGYLMKSSRSQLIYSPAETTHFFPYEAPTFCTRLVEKIMLQLTKKNDYRIDTGEDL